VAQKGDGGASSLGQVASHGRRQAPREILFRFPEREEISEVSCYTAATSGSVFTSPSSFRTRSSIT
jgi:hypothetical protein